MTRVRPPGLPKTRCCNDEGGGDGGFAPLAAAIEKRLAVTVTEEPALDRARVEAEALLDEEVGVESVEGVPDHRGLRRNGIFLSKQNGLKSGVSICGTERSRLGTNRNKTKQSEANETAENPLESDWSESGPWPTQWQRERDEATAGRATGGKPEGRAEARRGLKGRPTRV